MKAHLLVKKPCHCNSARHWWPSVTGALGNAAGTAYSTHSLSNCFTVPLTMVNTG